MNLHSPSSETDRSVAAAAERWLARHDRGLTPDEAAEFARWRAASPAGAAEYDRLSAAWRTADLAAADLTLAALAAEVDVATLRARRSRVRRTRAGWGLGLAAAAAVVFTFAGFWSREASPAAAVAVSAHAAVQFRPSVARTVALPDGSVVLLRGDSEVQPAFAGAERRVRLVRGEAHFTVQPDPTRPFVVETEALAVRAVGTSFNVKRASDAIDVIVTEGTIALAAPSRIHEGTATRAEAGHRARLKIETPADSGAPVVVEAVLPAEVDRELDWQVGRLTFERASLAEAVAAFNQHAGTRFELADPILAARQISGSFRADRADAFVRLLQQAAEVRVEHLPDGRIRLFPEA